MIYYLKELQFQFNKLQNHLESLGFFCLKKKGKENHTWQGVYKRYLQNVRG